MKISFTLIHDGKETETQGVIALELRKDWGWGVSFIIDSEDMLGMRFGCMGGNTYELDEVLGYDESKKLHVTWGGNSISNPVVY
jgi:hypothetical protein